MTTISIVTPSYNQGRYIEETINSVIYQKGKFFVDYIIMDGGSTDDSVKIINKYDEIIKNGKFQPKCLGVELRWVSEKDRGQTHAINKGFKIAKGEVVSYINSDDTYFDNAFSIVIKHFSMRPGDDFVFGDGDVIDEYGNLQWEWLSRPYNFKLLKSYHYLWNDFTNYIMQQATFWRRNVFNKIGMLDESLHYAMDIEYWMRAGATGLKLTHIPAKLGKFRMISDTKSLSSPTAFWPDMLEVFRKYNGANKMAPFFSYYFYNIARNNNYNMDEAWIKRLDIFSKWECLDKKEIDILDKNAGKGFKKACLISINKAFYESDKHISIKIFKNNLRNIPLLIFHPLMLLFTIKYFLGRAVLMKLNKPKESLINFYRQKKYQYRYLEKNH